MPLTSTAISVSTPADSEASYDAAVATPIAAPAAAEDSTPSEREEQEGGQADSPREVAAEEREQEVQGQTQ